MPELNEKAWLFHRGIWKQIKNPLFGRGSHEAIDRRQSLFEYRRRWWNFGPTFLHHDYAGIRLYTYIYDGTKKLPKFLIRIDAFNMSELIFAQDLPDLLEVLALLAPLVLSGIFVDAYRRNLGKE